MKLRDQLDNLTDIAVHLVTYPIFGVALEASMACALLTRASDSIAPRKPDDVHDKDSFIRGCLWTGDLHAIHFTTLEWIISFRMSQAPTESKFLALDPLGINPHAGSWWTHFCALLPTSRTRYS